MSDVDERTICEICGKPVSRGPSSMTQWILGPEDVCICQAKTWARLESEIKESSLLCNGCGREIRQETDGTMTQWIFRSHYCGCTSPLPVVMLPEQVYERKERFIEKSLADYEQIGDESTAGWSEELTRYEPLRRLGQGSAGSVFLCKDTMLTKLVAVKCLRVTTPKNVVSFQNEARIASKLEHPGITRIIDFGVTESSSPYMVMEPICGISLRDHIETHGPLAEEEARRIGALLCNSLDYAHKAGTLHRDIKTSNVIMSKFEDELIPVLIDFGVAKLNQHVTVGSSSQEDTIAGTPEYMPPDSLAGEQYSEVSEVYSLGCVLFETLTGRVPFIANSSLSILAMHTSQKAPALSEVREDLEFSSEIEEIVARCLEKERSKRYQSMKELEQALFRPIEVLPATMEEEIEAESPTRPTNESIEEELLAARTPSRWVLAAVSILLTGMVWISLSIIIDRMSASPTKKMQHAHAHAHAHANSQSVYKGSVPSMFDDIGESGKKAQDNQNEGSAANALSSSASLESHQQGGQPFSEGIAAAADTAVLPAIRVVADSLPCQGKDFLVSKLGLVVNTPWGKALWRASDPRYTYLQNSVDKTILEMNYGEVRMCMNPRFVPLDMFKIQKAGRSSILGMNCDKYECFDRKKNKLATFWTTRELDREIPQFVRVLLCQAYVVPVGYGFPLKVTRSTELLIPETTDNPTKMGQPILPPAHDGFITQSVKSLERIKARESEFETPQNYEITDRFHFFNIDKELFGPGGDLYSIQKTLP